MIMLNTSVKLGNTNVTFNAPCVGMMQKSHPKSNFEKFQNESRMAEWVFSDYPRLVKEKYEAKKIVVLQAMTYGQGWFLIEYVYEDDLNQ